MPHLTTALDIGSSQIKGLVLSQKKDRTFSVITAFKHPSAGFRKGVLVDVEDASFILKDIAFDLQKISKSVTRNVFINVQSEHIKSRESKGIVAVARADGIIQQDDIDKVVQASKALKLFPNHLILHNIIREYIVDDIGDIVDPLGMTGNRLEASALIVEAFAPQINTLVKVFESVGIRIGGLVFNPLASSMAVLSKKQKELGVALVDFGYSTTSLAVYEENKLIYTKSFPMGSGYITNDIAIAFKTSIDTAERLKLEYGLNFSKSVSRKEVVKLAKIDSKEKAEISKRFLSEVIESRLIEILELIVKELKNLNKNVQLPAGIVAVGGGAKLLGITELIRRELKLPAQIGVADLKNFEITNPTYEDLLSDSEFATVVGLALWGSVAEKKPVDNFEAIKNFFKNLMP